jgi:hypothetical protein
MFDVSSTRNVFRGFGGMASGGVMVPKGGLMRRWLRIGSWGKG